jgi:hypothetical protein
MHSFWDMGGPPGVHSDDSLPPTGPPWMREHAFEIVPLQLKWGVGAADLHRE